MVLVSGHFPSAFPNPNRLPEPGLRPNDEAILVRLTSALAMDHPFAITGDVGQFLWLTPEAAEFAVNGKNAQYCRP